MEDVQKLLPHFFFSVYKAYAYCQMLCIVRYQPISKKTIQLRCFYLVNHIVQNNVRSYHFDYSSFWFRLRMYVAFR